MMWQLTSSEKTTIEIESSDVEETADNQDQSDPDISADAWGSQTVTAPYKKAHPWSEKIHRFDWKAPPTPKRRRSKCP